jgi:hypothetical protein
MACRLRKIHFELAKLGIRIDHDTISIQIEFLSIPILWFNITRWSDETYFHFEIESAKTKKIKSTKIMYSLMHCSLNLAAECNSAVCTEVYPQLFNVSFFQESNLILLFSIFRDDEILYGVLSSPFKISSNLLLIFCALLSSCSIIVPSFWS